MGKRVFAHIVVKSDELFHNEYYPNLLCDLK